MRFIVLDDLDGSGKDQYAKLIANYYCEKGEKVLFRVHPSDDNIFGIITKKVLHKKGKIFKIIFSIFYALDLIRSKVKYYDKSNDTIVFSGYIMKLANFPIAISILKFLLPTPQHKFFLDIKPEDLRHRINSLDTDDWIIIDASAPLEVVTENIFIKLKQFDKKNIKKRKIEKKKK